MNHWQTKLAAWTHDPAEKALVLLRDPAGHEGGTVRKLRQELNLQQLPQAIVAAVKRADHWASAADRPQFPRDGDKGPYQQWTQVRFHEQPQLIHPLSGQRYEIDRLDDIEAEHIKEISLDHFRNLIHPDADGNIDYRRTALAFWRFGPSSPAPELNILWELLPADTRIPDHTIWAHLDLTSAFATASVLDANQTPALLTVSFGPVQSFIAEARSTSDLWAGSHLLSRIAWEGLKVICERLGPDAVIFPQLRGVPLVDLWLREERSLCRELFEHEEWTRSETDRNPLFAAALPNKFVALVPADQAQELAETITVAVRDWVRSTAHTMLEDLLKTAGYQADNRSLPCWKQVDAQLQDFPEVHWAVAPWSLIDDSSGTTRLEKLAEALRLFYPPELEFPGYLGSDAWKLLNRDLRIDNQVFYKPNPGTLYPALYDLVERLAAATKGVREFGQTAQHGYRDTLGGETEWLTTDRDQLGWTPRQREDNDTLWTKAAKTKRFGIRRREHLGALGMLKRLWPVTFAREMGGIIGFNIHRYVVSTHTIALATTFERWLKNPQRAYLDLNNQPHCALSSHLENAARAVLPRKLDLLLRRDFGGDEQAQKLLRRLPTHLDDLRDMDNENALQQAESVVKNILGAKPEAYYALILLDGDRMGAWLSGSAAEYRLRYRATWHTQIANHLAAHDRDDLKRYLDERRAVSPGHHMAISGALNGFALHIAPYIVEELYKGKLFYAGGDDVMAMVSVDDLLPLLASLRLAYSGLAPDDALGPLLGWGDEQFKLGDGHALVKKRSGRQNYLYRMMGDLATASTGAVIAHHTAPLAAVLRELRASEQRAKTEGASDAFAITLRKRSGGAVRLTSKWFDKDGGLHPITLLMHLRNALSSAGFSRRVVYLAQEWLPQLPAVTDFEGDTDTYRRMLTDNLRYQFKRQNQGRDTHLELAEALARLAAKQSDQAIAVLQNFIAVAEFLARASRSDLSQGGEQ